MKSYDTGQNVLFQYLITRKYANFYSKIFFLIGLKFLGGFSNLMSLSDF